MSNPPQIPPPKFSGTHSPWAHSAGPSRYNDDLRKVFYWVAIILAVPLLFCCSTGLSVFGVIAKVMIEENRASARSLPSPAEYRSLIVDAGAVASLVEGITPNSKYEEFKRTDSLDADFQCEYRYLHPTDDNSPSITCIATIDRSIVKARNRFDANCAALAIVYQQDENLSPLPPPRDDLFKWGDRSHVYVIPGGVRKAVYFAGQKDELNFLLIYLGEGIDDSEIMQQLLTSPLNNLERFKP